MTTLTLPKRWTQLKHHEVQHALWTSPARFDVAACGRRSGKTEIAKRKLLIGDPEHNKIGLLTCPHEDGWFVYACPTRDQAKRNAWADFKRMIPPEMIEKVLESELTIRLTWGPELTCIGMDRPERAEGRILDAVVLDEYADMRPDAWEAHVRPALSTIGREGWALFIGTPDGRNHFHELWLEAGLPRNRPHWASFMWHSADILDPAEVEQARRSMDPRVFAQEYEASFEVFEGLAYYCWDRSVNGDEELEYDPNYDLICCLDFNVNPGTATILQERPYTGGVPSISKEGTVTHVLDEIWIPKGSNSGMVANTLLDRIQKLDHKKNVLMYGDATGGAKGTQAVDGSDWDIVRGVLRPHLGDRYKVRVGRSNPKEKIRVNSMNARLRTADGMSHCVVDPVKCPWTLLDFEGTVVIPGTAGELDKKSDPNRTHLTDGIGYYVYAKFPMAPRFVATTFA